MGILTNRKDFNQCFTQIKARALSTRDDFNAIVRFPPTRKLFYKELQKSYTEENLEFFIVLDRLQAKSDMDAFFADANAIYKTYVCETSTSSVNLPQAIQLEFDKAIQAKDKQALLSLIDISREFAVDFLMVDSFPAFKSSPAFAHLLRRGFMSREVSRLRFVNRSR